MTAFIYGVFLQWKLDIRSKTLLITCYLVPLLFFAIMGGIFISVMPEARDSLVQSMTIFGVTMGALIGVPPSLVEIYSSDIKKVYKANGVPIYLGLILTNISAFIHLFIMSAVLYIAAPLVFDAEKPENQGMYFICLAVFIAVSLGIASIIGLGVKDQAKTSMVSTIVFLPSIMLSGIMFPVELLPKLFEKMGNIFPASWGYRVMIENTFQIKTYMPFLLFLALSIIICSVQLHRIGR